MPSDDKLADLGAQSRRPHHTPIIKCTDLGMLRDRHDVWKKKRELGMHSSLPSDIKVSDVSIRGQVACTHLPSAGKSESMLLSNFMLVCAGVIPNLHPRSMNLASDGKPELATYHLTASSLILHASSRPWQRTQPRKSTTKYMWACYLVGSVANAKLQPPTCHKMASCSRQLAMRWQVAAASLP